MDNEAGIWQDLIHAKYIKNYLINTVKLRFDDSPVWKDLLKVRYIYLSGRRIQTNSGGKTMLWTEPWVDDEPLCWKYSTLFELSNEKDITLERFRANEGETSFRRWLPVILRDQWDDLKGWMLNQLHNRNPDKITWKWTKTGIFSVKST